MYCIIRGVIYFWMFFYANTRLSVQLPHVVLCREETLHAHEMCCLLEKHGVDEAAIEERTW